MSSRLFFLHLFLSSPSLLFPRPPSVQSSTSSQLAGVLKLSSPFSLSVALQVTHSWPPYTSPPHMHVRTHRYHPPPEYKRVLKLGMELNPWKEKRKEKKKKKARQVARPIPAWHSVQRETHTYYYRIWQTQHYMLCSPQHPKVTRFAYSAPFFLEGQPGKIHRWFAKSFIFILL